MNRTLRVLHRKTAPIIFIPLLLAALTGVTFRIGRSWFGMSDEVGELFLEIHQGEFLGEPLVPIYVLLMGLGLLGMIVTGFTMISVKSSALQSPLRSPKWNGRWVHRVVAIAAFLPLTISALTGISYRLSRAWFGLPKEQVEFLMDIHQGSYLGSTLRPFYVLLVGVGLVGLLVTGISMTGIFAKRRLNTPPDPE